MWGETKVRGQHSHIKRAEAQTHSHPQLLIEVLTHPIIFECPKCLHGVTENKTDSKVQKNNLSRLNFPISGNSSVFFFSIRIRVFFHFRQTAAAGSSPHSHVYVHLTGWYLTSRWKPTDFYSAKKNTKRPPRTVFSCCLALYLNAPQHQLTEKTEKYFIKTDVKLHNAANRAQAVRPRELLGKGKEMWSRAERPAVV